MCFRPVEAALPVKCPTCGTTNSNGATACFKCGADLASAKGPDEAAPAAARPAVPAVPVVPSVPAAPSCGAVARKEGDV